MMPKHLPANYPDQLPMPFDDLGKCTGITMPHELHQQFAIRGSDGFGMVPGW
jgi:hypothetical protein